MACNTALSKALALSQLFYKACMVCLHTIQKWSETIMCAISQLSM